MKKSSLLKRIGCLVLCVTVLLSALGTTACTPAVPNNETTIQLSYWNSGFGSAWLDNLIKKFEAAYPEYDVYLEPTANQSYFDTTIEYANDTTVDLFITGALSGNYSKYLEPMDDVLNFKHQGESKTIAEKMSPSVYKAMQAADGKLYGVSYGGGLLSLAYDKTVIDGTKYEIPRTTDELVELVIKLEADYRGVKKPFITFADGGYWRYVFKAWLVQYNGMDYYYNDFLKLETDGGEPDKDMLVDQNKETGRFRLLQLLEKIFNAKYVTEDSASGQFSAQQTKFLNGRAVMMPNGTWLYNEMKKTPGFDADNAKFGFMKMPVLSAIIDNLEEVEDDIELSDLIAEIDKAGGDVTAVPTKTAKYDVSENDVKRVYEARNLITSNLDECSCMIPVYSNAKEAAKTFLKFMYKDQMIKEYSDIIHMLFPASLDSGSIDTSAWNGWEKDVYNIQTICSFLPKAETSSKVLSSAGMYADGLANATMNPYRRFSAQENPWTAQKYWEKMQEIYNENWQTYLQLAGLR